MPKKNQKFSTKQLDQLYGVTRSVINKSIERNNSTQNLQLKRIFDDQAETRKKVDKKLKAVQDGVDKANNGGLKYGGSVMNSTNLVIGAMDAAATNTFGAIEAFKNGDKATGAGFIVNAASSALPAIGGIVSGVLQLTDKAEKIANLAGPAGAALGTLMSLVGLLIAGINGMQEKNTPSVVDQIVEKLQYMDARDRLYHIEALETMFNSLLHNFLSIKDDSLTMTDLLTRAPMNRGAETMQLLVIENWLLDSKNHAKLDDWAEVSEAYNMTVQLRCVLMICGLGKLKAEYKSEQVENIRNFFLRTQKRLRKLLDIYQNACDVYISGGSNRDRIYHSSETVNGSKQDWDDGAGDDSYGSAFYASPSRRLVWVLWGNTIRYAAVGTQNWNNLDTNNEKVENFAGLGNDRLLIKTKDSLSLMKLHFNEAGSVDETEILSKMEDIQDITKFHANANGVVAILKKDFLYVGQVSDTLKPLTNENIADWSEDSTAADNFGKWQKIDMTPYLKGTDDVRIRNIFVNETAIFVEDGKASDDGYMEWLPLPPYTGDVIAKRVKHVTDISDWIGWGDAGKVDEDYMYLSAQPDSKEGNGATLYVDRQAIPCFVQHPEAEDWLAFQSKFTPAYPGAGIHYLSAELKWVTDIKAAARVKPQIDESTGKYSIKVWGKGGDSSFYIGSDSLTNGAKVTKVSLNNESLALKFLPPYFLSRVRFLGGRDAPKNWTSFSVSRDNTLVMTMPDGSLEYMKLSGEFPFRELSRDQRSADHARMVIRIPPKGAQATLQNYHMISTALTKMKDTHEKLSDMRNAEEEVVTQQIEELKKEIGELEKQVDDLNKLASAIKMLESFERQNLITEADKNKLEALAERLLKLVFESENLTAAEKSQLQALTARLQALTNMTDITPIQALESQVNDVDTTANSLKVLVEAFESENLTAAEKAKLRAMAAKLLNAEATLKDQQENLEEFAGEATTSASAARKSQPIKNAKRLVGQVSNDSSK